jgi:hypothetical protein
VCNSSLRLDATASSGWATYDWGRGREVTVTSLDNALPGTDFRTCVLHAGTADITNLGDGAWGDSGPGRTTMIGGAGTMQFEISRNNTTVIGGTGFNMYDIQSAPGATIVGGFGTFDYYQYIDYTGTASYDTFLEMNTTFDPARDHSTGVNWSTTNDSGSLLWDEGAPPDWTLA